MAQKLHPVKLVPTTPHGLQIVSREFCKGWVEGAHDQQVRPRFDISGLPTESGLYFIVLNLCELFYDGELTEQQLRRDVGLVAGWVTRGVYSTLKCE
jgi:hypothetical protein